MNNFRSVIFFTHAFLFYAFSSSLYSAQSESSYSPGYTTAKIYNTQTKTWENVFIQLPQPSGVTVNFLSTTSNNADAAAHPSAAAHPHLQSEQKTLQKLPLPHPFYNNETSQSWSSLLFSKKGLGALCGITFITYATIYYKLKKAVWLLDDQNAWCNWKNSLALEELFALSRYELAEELLKKIQTKYVNHRNPSDHIAPLNIFLESYAQEIKTFQSHFRMVKWLKRLRLTRFFPTSHKHLEIMKNKIQRLSYLKTIFFSWMTEYKTSRCKLITEEEVPQEPLPVF